MPKKELIKEFKSDDGQSTVPDPVVTGNPRENRSADTNSSPKPDEAPSVNPEVTKVTMIADIVASLSKKNKASIKPHYDAIKESLDEDVSEDDEKLTADDLNDLFANFNLDEDFKTKASTIFEAALNLRVEQEKVKLVEESEAILAEEIEKAKTEMEDRIAVYLDDLAEKWLEENEVALQHNLRVEMSESLINGLVNLLEAHYIDLPEEKVSVVETLAQKVDELEEALNSAIEEKADLKEAIEIYQANELLADMSEGLSLTEKDKLKALAENIDFDTFDEFKSKLETLKESVVTTVSETKTETLTEDTAPVSETKSKETEIDYFAKYRK